MEFSFVGKCVLFCASKIGDLETLRDKDRGCNKRTQNYVSMQTAKLG